MSDPPDSPGSPDSTAYGASIADVYDDLYVEELPTDAAVERLAALAAGGAVLELGIGTGRLALPLTALGLEVHGVDSSAAMVARLHAKPGGKSVPVVVGDFAEVRMSRQFALVVLAFNTILALPTQQAQVAVFANAAAHLEPGGRFVLECWVPDPAAFRSGRAIRLLSLGAARVIVEAAEVHPADQTMRTTKLLVTDGSVRLLPANHRYAWPAEFDLMAQLAGLTLEHRWADWTGSPFTDESTAHISAYRR